MRRIYCHDCEREHVLAFCIDCGVDLHPPSDDAPYFLSLPDESALCLPCARERVVRPALAHGVLYALGGTSPEGKAAIVTRSGLVLSDRLCSIFPRFRGGWGDRRVRLRFALPGLRAAADTEQTVWEGTLFLNSGLVYARLNRDWRKYLGHCLICLAPVAWPADITPASPRSRPARGAPALEL